MSTPRVSNVDVNTIFDHCYNNLSLLAKKAMAPEFWNNRDEMRSYLPLDNSIHFNTEEGVEFYTKASDSHPYSKLIGMIDIFNILQSHTPDFYDGIGVDFLGGSGQIEKVMKEYYGTSIQGFITADISYTQICEGIKKRNQVIPCDIMDPKSIKDESLNWAVIAYGFHHIAPDKRLLSLINAYTKLKKGGTLILHDGFVGGSTIDIMSKIVDCHSKEPHIYPFLCIDDFKKYQNYFMSTFKVTTEDYNIFDPQVFFGSGPEQLKSSFALYMKNHYYLDLSENEIYERFTQVFEEYCRKELDSEQCVFLRMEEHNLTKFSQEIAMNQATRRAYASNLYLGPTPALIKEVYSRHINFDENPFCLIVPRFAHILVIKKQ